MNIIYLICFIIFLSVLFLLFFIRQPIRININNNILVSPCDGNVMNVDNNNISIFLSPLDVHWQYVPIDSVVKDIEIISGKHKMAFKPQSEHNEGIKVTFGSELGDIIVTQRVGFLVRRINNNIEIGDEVKQSAPYGIIVFGSRVDIIIPENLKCILKKGQKVKGGITPLI